MHIFYFILKETSKYNLSTLYHSHYMLQTSTIRLYCLFLLLLLKTQCSPEEQFLQPHSVFFIVHQTQAQSSKTPKVTPSPY